MNKTSSALGWMPLLLSAVDQRPVTRQQADELIAENPALKKWGGAPDLLGGLCFLRNVGFLEENKGVFTITLRGQERLAAFGI